MNKRKILKRSAAVLASLALAVGLAATQLSADAASNAYAPLPLPTNSVGAGQLAPNSVGYLDWGSALRGEWNANKAKLNAVQVTANDAKNMAEDALAKPDKGTEAVTKEFAPATVDKIGGKFADNATLIGTVTLPKGTLKVDVDGFWTTLDVGPAGTRPQLALRGTDVSVTIFPGEASPAKSRELTGHATKKVVLSADTEVKVYAFGYNDDQSANGGGRLSVAASIVATYL